MKLIQNHTWNMRETSLRNRFYFQIFAVSRRFFKMRQRQRQRQTESGPPQVSARSTSKGLRSSQISEGESGGGKREARPRLGSLLSFASPRRFLFGGGGFLFVCFPFSSNIQL